MSVDSELAAALELVEAQIAADVAAHVCPGLSVAVVQGSKTVWARGFGYADVERGTPAGPDTVYGVGSITKLFTATMLMQLRDAGKLRLDDPVQHYVPEVRVPRQHPGAPEITFRHLVTHTAGLPKDAPLGYWGSWEFPDAERVMASFAETEQPYPPGTVWKYSNYGFALLGYTLARIAGQPWETYVEEQILRPLEMTNTAPRLTAALRPEAATGYHRPVDGWPPKPIPHLDLGGIGPGGSLHSSVADMARFIAEQFASEPRLLRRSTVEEMHRIQWLNPDWQGGRGIAWGVHPAGGTTRIEHGGAVYGLTCKILLSPHDQIGVAVFTNGSNGNVGVSLATRTLDQLVAVRRAAAGRQTVEAPASAPAAWQRYVGRYRWVFGDCEVLLRDGALLLRLPNGPLVEEVRLVPETEHVFRMPSGPVLGEQARFVLGADGEVTRLWVGPHPHEHI